MFKVFTYMIELLEVFKDLETNELMSYANTYHSEDNLRPLSPRTPSYLRVSCALNGYRQSYRRPGEVSSIKQQQLPMSIVERRTALFNNPSQIKLVNFLLSYLIKECFCLLVFVRLP